MDTEPSAEYKKILLEPRDTSRIPPLTPELEKGFHRLLGDVLAYKATRALSASRIDPSLFSNDEKTHAMLSPSPEPDANTARQLSEFGDIIGNDLAKNSASSYAFDMLNDLEEIANGDYPIGLEGFLNAMRLGSDALAVRLRARQTENDEKIMIVRFLTSFSLKGDGQDAEQGIDAMLSAQELLREEMMKNILSDISSSTLYTTLERGTQNQLGVLRRVVADAVRDPAFDTVALEAVSTPRAVNPVRRDYAAKLLSLVAQSFGLPASLVGLWRRSEAKKALGVSRNLKTLIKLEQHAAKSGKELYSKFGIRYFGRYPLNLLIRQYEEINSDQPYGVMVYPGVEDERGVFYQDIEWLQKFDDSIRAPLHESPLGVRIVEARSRKDLAARLGLLGKRYGQHHMLSFAVISGHGNAGLLMLGEGEPRDTYSLRDLEHRQFQKGGMVFKSGAVIILQSCKTGVLLAQRLSRAFPDTYVYAPIVATYLTGIDRLEKKNDFPELLPTYGTGDVWVLYHGGKMISCNEEGTIEDNLTKEKTTEIIDVCRAIGETKITDLPLRRVEQTVFAKRLRAYATFLQELHGKGISSFSESLPLIRMIASAAARYVPSARRAATGLLAAYEHEINTAVHDPNSNETAKNDSIESLAYGVQCASGQDRARILSRLDKLWPEIEKRIARYESSLFNRAPAVIATFLQTYLLHGDDASKEKVKKCIDALLTEAMSPNETLADELPSDLARTHAVQIAAELLSYWHADTRKFAQEIIFRSFQDFTPADTQDLIESWFGAQAYTSDRQELIRRNLTAAAKLENRLRGSVHALFTEYGIRNFGSYPFDVLKAQYVEGRESKLPHVLLLYPQKSIMASSRNRDYYPTLWNNLNSSLERKGVRIRVAEWGDESDIAHFVGTDAINPDATQLIVMGSRGNSAEMLYKKGNRWKTIRSSALKKKQGLELFGSINGKTVILDMPCAGKRGRFAQTLSKQAQCTILASYDDARLSVIQPTMFHPKKIESGATYGPAGVGVYRNGEAVKE